jgi:N-acylneuraminate cytidylyltransferase
LDSKTIAIIPARGGSKRIRKKNIKPFHGKPIISYAIETAHQTGVFDEVMVSTDEPHIAEISRQSGAQVPFLRSENSSGDHAGLADVLIEVIKEYGTRGVSVKYVCCILPTAVFATAEQIVNGYSKIKNELAQAVIPVSRFSYPPQRAFIITNGLLEMKWPENYVKRSQDLEPFYHDTGQFYWLSVSDLLTHKKLFMPNTIGMEIDNSAFQDIDTPDDWEIAEFKYTYRNASR